MVVPFRSLLIANLVQHYDVANMAMSSPRGFGRLDRGNRGTPQWTTTMPSSMAKGQGMSGPSPVDCPADTPALSIQSSGGTLERISPTATRLTDVSERAAASEPRDRREPAQRRARARVGESEGRSPSDKTRHEGGQRRPAGALRDRGRARQGRNGRGVSRPGHTPRPPRRAQDSPSRVRRRQRPAASLYSRGEIRIGAESPEHHHRLRHWRSGRHPLHRLRVHRRHDAERACPKRVLEHRGRRWRLRSRLHRRWSRHITRASFTAISSRTT